MPTSEKAQVIEQAKEWYDKSQAIVFTDYRGLSVKEFQSLRKQLKAKGGEIHVVKNTLFRRAAGDDIEKIPAEYHNGTTAIAFLYSNESEGSKVIADFVKSSKKLAIKGGFFNGKAFDASGVEAISKLPPRDVLIAQVIGTIVAPLTNLIGTIEAIYASPIRTIYAVADKLGAGDAAPEAKAPEAPAPVVAPVEEAAQAAESTEAEAAEGETTEAPAEEVAAEASEAVAEAPAEEVIAEATTEEAPAEETPAENPTPEPAADEAAADPTPEA